MTSTQAEDYLKQSQNIARKAMDTNNSLSSKISDEMFSLLEAGEGSFYLRDQIDNFLDNRIRGLNSTLGYQWTTLRQLMSIKDKIAYAVAIEHTHTLYPANPNDVIVDEKILPHINPHGIVEETLKKRLDEVIQDVEENLLTKQEFTESWILRHAAINRFSCNLDTAERAKLNTFANKVKKLCSDQGFDILAESSHFTFESDAQKIIKLNEVLAQLSAMGVVIPDDILKEFSGNGEKDKNGKTINGFERHIEKLKSVDKAYKHLTNTLQMVHETAKNTDKSMITPKQKKQLEEVMDKLELRKIIEDRIVDFNKEENFDKNTEHGTPMELLKTIKGSTKFTEVISAIGIENDFDHWFLSWVTFELTHGAHSLLTKKKSEAFGGEKKKYEEDCNSRRGMMRNKIFEVYDRNVALRGAASRDRDFADDADFDRMNSYFTKFPNLFFNSPDDNYNHVEGENPADRNALHFDKMRSILAAILRRRVPALRSSDRIRRGSYPKIIVDWARHALKGDQRGIFNWIDRQIEHADDASIIAMTIMFQNEANNKLFYEEKDPFEVKPKRYSKIFKKVAGAEKGRQAVRDKFAPATNLALKATETTVKGAVGAAAWTVQKGANIINTPLEKINEWMGKQSNWNPIKLGMIATKPMQWLLNPLSKGIKTGKDGERTAITDVLSNGYKVGTEALPVKEGEEKKTKYLFQWLTRGIGSITEFFGKTVADSGQWMQDKYTVASQRNVLGALYDAGQKEDRWKDLMASGGLENVLNLKNIGPKLFDDDGRILPVDKPEEDCPEIKAGKNIIKKLKEQLQDLQKGIEEEKSNIQKRITKAIEENNDNNQDYFFSKLSQIQTKDGMISQIKIKFESLLPLLKDPIKKDADIKRILSEIIDLIDNSTKGFLTIAKEKIKDILDTDKTNTKSKAYQQNLIINAQTDINEAESEISAYSPTPGVKGSGDPSKLKLANSKKNTAQNDKATAKLENTKLNDELLDLNGRTSWLEKTKSLSEILSTTIDKDTLNTFINSLDLAIYKPASTTVQQTTQQTANNLAGALVTS
ncbi:hypothetical protein P148_SR1C00001G0010 [candidate division SR1 bacterium RAAC1_SR1_1]|nr:hypothetical protein P148_SR1C00001G0010 [candidate division SR1 bacterium RAAC1_SR1_1]